MHATTRATTLRLYKLCVQVNETSLTLGGRALKDALFFFLKHKNNNNNPQDDGRTGSGCRCHGRQMIPERARRILAASSDIRRRPGFRSVCRNSRWRNRPFSNSFPFSDFWINMCSQENPQNGLQLRFTRTLPNRRKATTTT